MNRYADGRKTKENIANRKRGHLSVFERQSQRRQRQQKHRLVRCAQLLALGSSARRSMIRRRSRRPRRVRSRGGPPVQSTERAEPARVHSSRQCPASGDEDERISRSVCGYRSNAVESYTSFRLVSFRLACVHILRLCDSSV